MDWAAKPSAKKATVLPVKTVSSQENWSAPKTRRTTGILRTIKMAAAGKVKKRIWCMVVRRVILKDSRSFLAYSFERTGSAAWAMVAPNKPIGTANRCWPKVKRVTEE